MICNGLAHSRPSCAKIDISPAHVTLVIKKGKKWTNMSSAERGEKGEGLPALSFTSIKGYVLNRDTIQVCRNIHCAGDRGEEM